MVNRFRCPYGEKAKKLVKWGRLARFAWWMIKWHNLYWKGSSSVIPSECDSKCYHLGEPSIMDMADYDDVVKALYDGRMARIMREYERYEKEHEGQASGFYGQ